jgi:uncharacterized protein (DUF1015 family)
VPRFEPFAGLRYRATDLSALIAPPYDVISPAEQAALEARSPHNAVWVELPRETSSMDRYQSARAILDSWLRGGTLVADEAPRFYIYRMSYRDEAGQPRATTGAIGALGLGDDDVLPHEQTTPKAKSDRLDLLRATGTNLSPIWGLSLASSLTSSLHVAGPPDARGVDGDGVEHALWVVDAPSIGKAIASAPVVIADGHHRYEVASAYAASREGRGPWDAVMAFVVELAADQLTVAAIHRLVTGLPRGFDLRTALAPWFSVAGSLTVDGSVTSRLVDEGALGLLTPSGAWLLRPLADTDELDSRRLDAALAELPPHDLTYQHGVENVAAAVASGAYQAGFLLRPATVAQISAVAHARDRMPPKTTFFTPKPATGMVFRSVA